MQSGQAFGEQLAALRKSVRLSQRKLSELSGVSNTMIASLERGKSTRSPKPVRPSFETLRRLARGLAADAAGVVNMVAENEYYDTLLKAAGYSSTPQRAIPTVGRVIATQDISLPIYKAHAGTLEIPGQGPVDTFRLRAQETYIVEVYGHCLFDLGVEPGDHLIVDRSMSPTGGKIVVARVGEELLLARWNTLNGKVRLTLSDGQTRDIWTDEIELQGVVTTILKRAP